MDYVALSREISYALRHAPHEYGVTPDEQGWVNLNDLISALRTKMHYEALSTSDVETMIRNSEKKRHEILDGRIRALYGHSLQEKIVKEPVRPPDILYHGTPNRFIDNILQVGLLAQNRQYVHLSEDKETASIVGKRRDNDPIILEVNAKNAHKEGVLFYKGNENIWLSDSIPPKFIKQIN